MKNLGTSSEHRTQQSQRKARGGVIVCMGERPYYGRKGVCGVWRVRATTQKGVPKKRLSHFFFSDWVGSISC